MTRVARAYPPSGDASLVTRVVALLLSVPLKSPVEREAAFDALVAVFIAASPNPVR